MRRALNIFNQMTKRITTGVRGAEATFTDPGASFLLGGYDSHSKRFALWSLNFDKTAHQYVAHFAPNSAGTPMLCRLFVPFIEPILL
jgi:hypothetical protein